MPERQPPVMRAATTGERVRDTLRQLFQGAADQPLGQIADALGVADLAGVAGELDSARPDGLRIATARRKGAPMMGGAGSRIKPQQQSALSSELKIPRFRSPLGTFVKHEGQWWRMPKQPGDGTTMTLERMPTAVEAAEMGIELTPKTAPLERKTVSVADFYRGVLDAKGTKLPSGTGPKRRGASSSRPQPTLRSTPVEPGPKTTRLYRVEPKDLGDKGEWLKKHLSPEDYNQFVSERGRLFADDLATSERFGHGAPDRNTFVVDVPADVAAAAKRSHRDGYTEFLLPEDVVAGKRLFSPADAKPPGPGPRRRK